MLDREDDKAVRVGREEGLGSELAVHLHALELGDEGLGRGLELPVRSSRRLALLGLGRHVRVGTGEEVLAEHFAFNNREVGHAAERFECLNMQKA